MSFFYKKKILILYGHSKKTVCLHLHFSRRFMARFEAQLRRHSLCHFQKDSNQRPVQHDLSDPHCMLNTTDKSAKILCNLCGRKFQSDIWLEQHMQQHMDPQTYNNQCSHCDVRYDDQHRLKTHLNDLTGEAPFRCQPCDTDSAYDIDLAKTSLSTSIPYSKQPKLVQSSKGKVQIIDQGYILCVNKPTKNSVTFFRCVNRGAGCKANASVEGILENGKFKISWHNIDKHTHPPDMLEILKREFDTVFRQACLENLETPVMDVFEMVKLDFLKGLSPANQEMFQAHISHEAKNKAMMAYRFRDKVKEAWNEETKSLNLIME